MKKKAEAASLFLAQAAAWIYILAMAVAMPFYYEQGYTSIGTNKSTFFHKYGFPILGAALITATVYGLFVLERIYREKKGRGLWQILKKEVSATDLYMFLYLAALCLSFLFSPYPETAKMGNNSWYMGFLPHVALVASYLVLSRIFRGLSFLLPLLILVNSVVFGLGILNRYGVYPLEMENRSPHFISTIGNINWYSGYWSVLVWIGILLFWNDDKTRDISSVNFGIKKHRILSLLLGLAVAIGLAAGVSQGSDSGIMALAVGLFVLFAISVSDGARMERFLLILIILSLVCIVGFAVDRIVPEACTFYSTPLRLLTQTALPWLLLIFSGGAFWYIHNRNKEGNYPVKGMKQWRNAAVFAAVSALLLYLVLLIGNTWLSQGIGPLSEGGIFTFDRNWGSARGGTWTIGIEVWKSQDFLHKLFGLGPDCMGEYIYSGENETILSMAREQFGKQRLLNAHGEWITNLVNLGMLGTAAFAGIIIGAGGRFLKGAKHNAFFYLFVFCILGYTINNIFSFQTTLNTTQLFLMIGVGEGMLRRESP